ncbi:hypothetical protein [Gimesia aquarii]|uniref:Uncharacterized protein n=1 Tax=Gimesia aquarii TaxID=2527964 RepID=A0A517W1Y9_9PLAN|nr:hypothetical protein [Gimesia aquarii]QDT99285.1 hypothetical protein V144x_47960 [Gimesia aquarii]
MLKINSRDILVGVSFLITFISLYCFLALVVSKWGLGSVKPTLIIVCVYLILNVLMVKCTKKQIIPHLAIFFFWFFIFLFDLAMSKAHFIELFKIIFWSYFINIVFVIACQQLIAKFPKK